MNILFIFEDMTLTTISLISYIDAMKEMLTVILKNTFFTICWGIR